MMSETPTLAELDAEIATCGVGWQETRRILEAVRPLVEEAECKARIEQENLKGEEQLMDTPTLAEWRGDDEGAAAAVRFCIAKGWGYKWSGGYCSVLPAVTWYAWGTWEGAVRDACSAAGVPTPWQEDAPEPADVKQGLPDHELGQWLREVTDGEAGPWVLRRDEPGGYIIDAVPDSESEPRRSKPLWEMTANEVEDLLRDFGAKPDVRFVARNMLRGAAREGWDPETDTILLPTEGD